MGDSDIDTAVSLLANDVKSLVECCKQVTEQQVSEVHLEKTLERLTKDQQNVLMNILSLNLSLSVSVPVIYDETYWKRKCTAGNWNYVHFWINDCSWRETFICHHVEETVDKFLARKICFGKMAQDLEVFEKPLKKLKINGYKGNVHEDGKNGAFDCINNSFEENAGKIFAFFPNLEEVYLNIAPAEYAVRKEKEGTEKRETLIKNIFSLKLLTKLSIIGFSLTKDQILVLAELLLDSSVSYLNLACNLLADDSCAGIANILQTPKLETLVLSNNCITCTGVEKILNALQKNVTLVSLDLSKNYIGDEGGTALAECLKDNTTLKKIDVSFNKLGSNTGLVLNDVIRSNLTLLCLNFSGNPFGKEIGILLAEAIAVNKSLRYFGIEFCGFSEHEEDVIYSVIHKNRNGNDSGIFM